MVEGHPEVARLSQQLPDGALQLPPPLQVRPPGPRLWSLACEPCLHIGFDLSGNSFSG